MDLLEFMMARYLVSFGSKKYSAIYNRVRYLTSQKHGIAYFISHNYAKIKVDSYDYLPQENTLTFHNFIILIKAVFDKNKTNYYYNIFLEKCSYK